MLRGARAVPGPYREGDLIMFKREQGADLPEERWRGIARIIGFDRNDDGDVGTVWAQSEAGVIATALHLMSPPIYLRTLSLHNPVQKF